jgi:2-polyprenyl-3-methyl-5-hydroxy-6-metoxy-1,4-benzoquinol methylase
VAGCCASRDYEKLFGRRTAAHDARRYRKRGLTRSALELVALAGDVREASILEVGGGVGSIELELLAAGAARATNVELSGEYEQEAAKLLDERGLADRVERRVGDFVEDAAGIDPHDVVVMHRVVCCYPDADALVGAAAERARRRMVLTYPRERALTRTGARVVNAFLRLSGSGFRVYVHPFDRIVAAAARHRLLLERREANGAIWESAAFATSAR